MRRLGCWRSRRRPASAERATCGHPRTRPARRAADRRRSCSTSPRRCTRPPTFRAHVWRAGEAPHLARVRERAGSGARTARADRAQRRRERRDPRHSLRRAGGHPQAPANGAGPRPRATEHHAPLHRPGRRHRRGDRDRAQRPLRDPDPRRSQGPGEGDRPRPERLGRDALRRAAERGRAEQHLDPGHPRRGPRGGADP